MITGIRELADLGPFFALRIHPAGATRTAPWSVLADLTVDPAALRDRVEAIRERLAAAGGQPTVRVAASVTHLGLVARLIAPALAAAAGPGLLLDFDLADTWWEPVPGGAVPLSISDSRIEPAATAQLLRTRLLDGPVHELTAAFARLSVSERVLWGNVASAVNGAVTQLDAARPVWRTRTHAIATALLADPPLRGTSFIDATDQFRRRSCCLIYQIAPDRRGPVCGDCVLAGRS